jgi:hypothetical protein
MAGSATATWQTEDVEKEGHRGLEETPEQPRTDEEKVDLEKPPSEPGSSSLRRSPEETINNESVAPAANGSAMANSSFNRTTQRSSIVPCPPPDGGLWAWLCGKWPGKR